MLASISWKASCRISTLLLHLLSYICSFRQIGLTNLLQNQLLLVVVGADMQVIFSIHGIIEKQISLCCAWRKREIYAFLVCNVSWITLILKKTQWFTGMFRSYNFNSAGLSVKDGNLLGPLWGKVWFHSIELLESQLLLELLTLLVVNYYKTTILQILILYYWPPACTCPVHLSSTFASPLSLKSLGPRGFKSLWTTVTVHDRSTRQRQPAAYVQETPSAVHVHCCPSNMAARRLPWGFLVTPSAVSHPCTRTGDESAPNNMLQVHRIHVCVCLCACVCKEVLGASKHRNAKVSAFSGYPSAAISLAPHHGCSSHVHACSHTEKKAGVCVCVCYKYEEMSCM